MDLDPMDDPSFSYARKFAERSYTSFMTSLNGLPIGKYFNVDCLDITITQTNTLNYILRIEYKNTYPDLIKVKLPYDVIKHIKSKEKLNDETKDTTKDAKKDTTKDKTKDETKDTTKETKKEKIQEIR